MSQRHVAVIGGGFSGTLQAINLLRRGARVTLIERAPRLARGVAYGTSLKEHVLNVRAGAMSAFPDIPDHFAQWLGKARGGDAGSFAERRLYGRYVEDLIASAAADAGDRLRILRGDAVDIVRSGAGETVALADGRAIAAEAVVLAIGNLPPRPPAGLSQETLAASLYVADPWRSDLAADLRSSDTILLVGTGLTAIDAALTLDAAGFRGKIVALSRRGLAPRAHAPFPARESLRAPPRASCTPLLRRVRADALQTDWRAAVDALRPVTQALWIGASPTERRRFVRHLRPWWDVHRHRIAPAVAERIGAMKREGRLAFRAGRLLSSTLQRGVALVTYRPRGNEAAATLSATRIVNCTGPRGDIARAGEPLFDALLRAGRIRPDPLRLGIDVNAQCRVIGGDGDASAALFAVGPMTRGTFWEVVAVPDIRVQVAELAERLAA